MALVCCSRQINFVDAQYRYLRTFRDETWQHGGCSVIFEHVKDVRCPRAEARLRLLPPRGHLDELAYENQT